MRTTIKLNLIFSGYSGGTVDGQAIRDYLASKGITGITLVDPSPATGDLIVDADQDVTAALTGATVGDSTANVNLNTAIANYRAAIQAVNAANMAVQAAATGTDLLTATKQLATAQVQLMQATRAILRYVLANL